MSLKQTVLTDFETKASLLSDAQKNAFESFLKEDFPTIKNEEWKFTNVSRLLNEDFFVAKPVQLSKTEIDSILIPESNSSNRLFFVNGILQKEISSWDSSLKVSHDITGTECGNLIQEKDNSFVSLNNALHPETCVITIPKGKVIEQAIELYYISKGASAAEISHPRIYISFEENAQATFVEWHKTVGEFKSLTNIVTEILVAKNVVGSYYKIQNDSDSASQINSTHIRQAGESVFTTETITFSGDILRNHLTYELNGERIESNMFGLYLTTGKTHVDNHTVADHKFPNCESHELYKGVVDEYSRGVFNGKIFVRQDAQKTNAFQSNRNILLSDTAIINTKPQLEIWADDVKCSHGCTTGQLDKTALFYLKARGIGEKKAKALLLVAFAEEVVEKIKVPYLKNYLTQVIENRLS